MALFGYFVSSIVFATVFFLCLVIWRERLLGIWLQLALFTTTLWSGYLALSSFQSGFNPSNQVFFELLRNAAWLLFMLKLYDFGRGGKDFWSLKAPWLVLFGVLALLTRDHTTLVNRKLEALWNGLARCHRPNLKSYSVSRGTR